MSEVQSKYRLGTSNDSNLKKDLGKRTNFELNYLRFMCKCRVSPQKGSLKFSQAALSFIIEPHSVLFIVKSMAQQSRSGTLTHRSQVYRVPLLYQSISQPDVPLFPNQSVVYYHNTSLSYLFRHIQYGCLIADHY